VAAAVLGEIGQQWAHGCKIRRMDERAAHSSLHNEFRSKELLQMKCQRIATRSSRPTLTAYSLPVSRRTTY
jgi:hypothetical protein